MLLTASLELTRKQVMLKVKPTKEQKAAKKAKELLEKQIEQKWYELATGVNIDIMKISNVFADATNAVAANPTRPVQEVIAESVKESIVKYGIK